MARSLKQLIETVEMLEERGIGMKSLTETIDTTTSGGKLVFHIFGALAEFERGIIRERTSAGLSAALAAADLAQAKALLADPDITVKQVAARMGVSISTLYKHLPAARSITKGEPQ